MRKRNSRLKKAALADAPPIDASALDRSIDAALVEELAPDTPYAEVIRLKEIAVAGKKRRELAESKGLLINAKDAARAWNEVAGKLQMSFLAIPDRIARECEGLSAREIREKLNTEIRRALMVVADEVRKVA
jgi:phage terminase Nu1 subunit (DNA packaging protein)